MREEDRGELGRRLIVTLDDRYIGEGVLLFAGQ